MRNKRFVLVKRIAVAGALLCVCVYTLLLLLVVARQDAFTPRPSDCLLVLGHSLEDGKTPGSWLIKRLETGLELYNSGYASAIIVSGGKGPTDDRPVADAMSDWLTAAGVSAADVIIEREASSTAENMAFTKDLMAERSFRSVVVVTNDFHIYRAMLAADAALPQPSGAAADVPMSAEKAGAYLKEPLSIVKYKLSLIFSGKR